MEDKIVVKNVSKMFGKEKVLDNVSLTVKKGSIVGIVGRNGSGKTVLFKLICGFYSASDGEIIVDGKKLTKSHSTPETIMELEKPSYDITIQEEAVDLDGLNYLAGKTLDFINKSAMKGTQLAHTDGNVPNLVVKVPEQNEFYLGQLFYFYEFACGVSGYILGVNPFNQPGVESYKKNMFALLGKPGFEAQREELMKRL